MSTHIAASVLGVMGGVLGAIAGTILLMLGGTVFVDGFDRYRVMQLGACLVIR